MVIGINSFLLDSGERYCLIVNKENGQPLYYSNLYLTTQIRNRGYSISTIESIAVNIALFYRFLNERNISIEDDFLEHKYLSNEDIDRLAIFMSQKFLLKKKQNKKQYASKYTLSRRLSNIAGYLFWLASILIKSHNQTNLALKMVNAIKARRPRNNQKFNN
ncbi:TPA: site-specific integrase, partial [Salmonella enterica subsp. salamae serovar 42:r:-]|nr:site-specific integrase [Salmonella enterica subsp. salamae serovar 42:r:-]